MLVSQGTTRPVTREGWGGSDLPTARKRATESAATRPVTRQAPATPTDLAGFRSPPFLLMDPGFEPERVRDTAEGLPDDPWFRDWYEGQVRSSSPSAGMRQVTSRQVLPRATTPAPLATLAP